VIHKVYLFIPPLYLYVHIDHTDIFMVK